MRKKHPHCFPNARLALFALVLAGASLTAAGCDADSADDDADREKLSGSWRITDLRVDGDPARASLDSQYPNAVSLLLRVDESKNEIFRVRSVSDQGDTLLGRSGTFNVDASDSELELNTEGGFLSLIYDFEASETDDPARVELAAEDDADAENLVDLLALDGFGNVEDASITIARERALTRSLRSSLSERPTAPEATP
ncbi:MAG: hypothetical protein BRD48_00335 [Bacteroidetes bacterium QS_9_68_14]|nr:MAG: hypothetical protein BRD48_00335 [Bacteroidetes bacterium QS_9_68_14]